MSSDVFTDRNPVSPSASLRWPRYGTAATWAFGVWLLQCNVTIATAISSLVDIEPMLLIAPIAVSLGLIMSLFALPLRSWWVFSFGMSPIVWTGSALLTMFHLGANTAQVPVSIFLLVCAALSAPLALNALSSIRNCLGLSTNIALQFSLRSLITAMTVLCVALGLAGIIRRITRAEELVALGFFGVILLVLSGGAAWLLLRGRSPWALWAWGFQSVATVAATCAAIVDIESIIVMGPVASALGLITAVSARPLRSWRVFWFGLSAPLTWIVGALWIMFGGLGPRSAQAPISVVLVVCMVLSVPLALIALRSIRYPFDRRSAMVWKFSLKSLLIVMTAICVALFVIRIVAEVSNDEERLAFGSFVFVVVGLAGGVVWYFLRMRGPVATFEPTAPQLPPDAARMAEALVAAGFFKSMPDAVTASMRSMVRQLNVAVEQGEANRSDIDEGPSADKGTLDVSN